jgi:hypothetical protein
VSNHLAVATVTGTLQRMIKDAVSMFGAAVAVTMRRPDGAAAAPGPGIHIFLYQVTPNAAYRNADLPMRRANGDLLQRPQTALVLHYLLSFAGDDGKLEPQRLLGAVARHLHAHPLLSQKDIEDTIKNPPLKDVLGASNLGAQPEPVRITPLSLSLEELSKVWSVFFQTPYLLSVAYQASVVLIETDDVPAPPALPVMTRNVYAVPFRHPVIDRIVSAAGDSEPILSTSTLRIVGQRFRADATFVLFDGVERAPTEVRDEEVRLTIPAGTEAGVHALQILQKQLMGAGAGTLHRGFESNVATFVLRPHFAVAPIVRAGGPALQLTFDLPVGQTQRVLLVLNSVPGAPQKVFQFVEPLRNANPAIVVFEIPDVDAGRYLVTVQVDGAANVLDLDSSSPTFGPTVTLP